MWSNRRYFAIEPPKHPPCATIESSLVSDTSCLLNYLIVLIILQYLCGKCLKPVTNQYSPPPHVKTSNTAGVTSCMSPSIYYTAYGCADVPEQPNAQIHRQGKWSSVRCNSTGETFYLLCVDSHWTGQFTNCTTTTSRTSVQGLAIIVVSRRYRLSNNIYKSVRVAYFKRILNHPQFGTFMAKLMWFE